ncbi:hypothetical protein EYF80_028731 [Liparis tanakae]|uniref:Uncharacterized protein n=1 Tax=Liparis tanakae TaxID=230148 RepID=A0A4Z2H5E1_9TELE|nr:hypothetical protein EYF80_028731 [Liparis tanakae]
MNEHQGKTSTNMVVHPPCTYSIFSSQLGAKKVHVHRKRNMLLLYQSKQDKAQRRRQRSGDEPDNSPRGSA